MPFLCSGLRRLEGVDDGRENLTDGRAQDCQNDDYDNGNQDEDQGVFYEALAFFTGHIQPWKIPYEFSDDLTMSSIQKSVCDVNHYCIKVL